MSSPDRYNRSNRARREPEPYDPDLLDESPTEDQWEIDLGAGSDDRSRGDTPPGARRSQPVRESGASLRPTADGTAAQLDRLRQNIRQSSRPAAARTPEPGSRRATAPLSSPRPPVRHDRPVDDRILSDTPFFDDDDDSLAPAKSRPIPARERRPAAIPRRQAARAPRYDDSVLNDDPYVDYDDFDDGFSDYDAPRPPERQPRPRPQLTMPALSRPTLPPAIAKADLVNDAPALGIIGVGLASLAGMAIVVANQANSLAPEFATHVSASGILERFRDETALWNIPLMAAMFTLMNLVMAWFISPLDRFASRFVLVGALVGQFLAWVAIIRIL